MFSLFGKGAEDARKTIAVVDIGTGSVGCALARLDREGPPTTLYESRTLLPVGPTRNAETLADAVHRSVTAAVGQMVEESSGKKEGDRASATVVHPKIEHTAVFVPAPLSTLFLKEVRFERATPFRVTTDLINKIVLDQVHAEKLDGKQVAVLERSAVGLRLNGYAVDDLPDDAMVERLEMTIISVTAPQELISSLSENIRRTIGWHVPVSFHSTSVAAAYALSAVQPNNPDFLLCNSEGEISEFLLSREHIPSGLASMPIGGNAIARSLSTHADMSRAEVSSALKLAKKPENLMARKLHSTLTATGKEYASAFRGALAPLIEQCGAIRTIYMLGTEDEVDVHADAVERSRFIKDMFPAGVEMKTVTYEMLAPFVKRTVGSGGKGDAFLALETLYADARYDQKRSFNFTLEAAH